MSNPADHDQPMAHAHADDPMSHVPPGSIWPLLVTVALTLMAFGGLAVMARVDEPFAFGFGDATWFKLDRGLGTISLWVGLAGLLFTLMGWCHQIIAEKRLSHDLMAQQADLKQFLLQFLLGEAAVFGAIFAYFYHRKIWDPTFGPPAEMHFGGPIVAYATLILISSSVTCEIAHRALEHGARGFAKLMFALTILLGVIFLGFQGFEYGELLVAKFSPMGVIDLAGGAHPAASFAGLFYIATGFHGLHVAIGLVMLFMVLFRLEVGHFRGHRTFSVIAASWYWHFVDIVWILLFITVYVVA